MLQGGAFCNTFDLVFKSDYRLRQSKSIAECSKGEHSAILLTCTKRYWVFTIFVLSIFEWPLKTGFIFLTSFPLRTKNGPSRFMVTLT